MICFFQQGRSIANLAKATYEVLHTAYPTIYTPKFKTAFFRNKNLKDVHRSTVNIGHLHNNDVDNEDIVGP